MIILTLGMNGMTMDLTLCIDATLTANANIPNWTTYITDITI